MHFRVSRFFVLSSFSVLFCSGVARADLLSNCGTCQGSTYLLQYDPSKTTQAGNISTYDVFLTIDPSGYAGSGAYIKAVAIKIASQDAQTGYSIISAPGGAGAWKLELGGLNSGGCDGSGDGFICVQNSYTAPVPPNPLYAGGTEYIWEFHYATSKPLLFGPRADSIKVEYVNSSGKKVGALVSEDITLEAVPDGGSTLLLIGGLVLALETLRRLCVV